MPVEVRAKWPGSEATKAPAFAAVLLVCGFIGVVAWFNGVDFYHRHFFESGPIVAVDNLLRMVFVGIFSWLIYVPGAAIAAWLMPASERAALSPQERAVLGFGIGVGVWHVGMLILGVAGLYYRLAMVMLCLVVLIASARHFADVAVSAWRALSNGCSELRRQRRVGHLLSTLVGVELRFLEGSVQWERHWCQPCVRHPLQSERGSNQQICRRVEPRERALEIMADYLDLRLFVCGNIVGCCRHAFERQFAGAETIHEVCGGIAVSVIDPQVQCVCLREIDEINKAEREHGEIDWLGQTKSGIAGV